MDQCCVQIPNIDSHKKKVQANEDFSDKTRAKLLVIIKSRKQIFALRIIDLNKSSKKNNVNYFLC